MLVDLTRGKEGKESGAATVSEVLVVVVRGEVMTRCISSILTILDLPHTGLTHLSSAQDKSKKYIGMVWCGVVLLIGMTI